MIDAIDTISRAHAPAGSASVAVIDGWPSNRINIPLCAAGVNFSLRGF